MGEFMHICGERHPYGLLCEKAPKHEDEHEAHYEGGNKLNWKSGDGLFNDRRSPSKGLGPNGEPGLTTL